MDEQSFYQQPLSYWDQVCRNLAGIVGSQHLTALDLVFMLTLFPLVVLGMVWWLPWERWLNTVVPKAVSGPYLIICALAFWHFHERGWLLWVFVILGAGLCAFAVQESVDRGKRWRREDGP